MFNRQRLMVNDVPHIQHEPACGLPAAALLQELFKAASLLALICHQTPASDSRTGKSRLKGRLASPKYPRQNSLTALKSMQAQKTCRLHHHHDLLLIT